MADKLKPSTPAWHARQARWRHNGFSGSARMMQMQALAICQSSTATDAAKALADEIYIKASRLLTELKTRKP